MIEIDRSRWRRVRFGDVIQSITERVDDPSTAGVERYVGLDHLDGGSLTINRWGSPEDVEATKLRFGPGDVVFARRRAYQRKLGQANFEGIASAHSLVLRARLDSVLPEFLPVFLSSDVFMDRAIQISVGSLSPTVNWKTLAIQEFDLPPLDEQRRIADLLWAVEAVSRAYAHEAAAAAKSAPGLISNLAGNAPRVPLGSLLTDIVDRRGVTPKKLGSDFCTDGIQVISAMNVGEGNLDLRVQARFIDEATYSRWMPRPLRAGDIILTSEAPLGRVVRVPDGPILCPGQRLFVLSPDRSKLSADYLYAWLAAPDGQRALYERSSGSTVRGIRQAELVKVLIPLPDLVQQHRIADSLGALASAAGNRREAREALISLRASIMLEIWG